MQKLPPHWTKTDQSFGADSSIVPVSSLQQLISDWLYEGEYSQNTKRTLEEKRNISNKLLWFLRERAYDECGVPELENSWLMSLEAITVPAVDGAILA